jgi:hypothetical protein
MLRLYGPILYWIAVVLVAVSADSFGAKGGSPSGGAAKGAPSSGAKTSSNSSPAGSGSTPRGQANTCGNALAGAGKASNPSGGSKPSAAPAGPGKTATAQQPNCHPGYHPTQHAPKSTTQKVKDLAGWVPLSPIGAVLKVVFKSTPVGDDSICTPNK